MNLGRLRLITFDITNTLLKFRASPGKQYGEVGAMFGVRCEDQKLAHNFRKAWQTMTKDYPNFGKYSDMGWQNWWTRLIDETFKMSGSSIKPNNLQHFSKVLLDLYKTSACWQHTYGAKEILTYFKTQQNVTKTGDEVPFVLGVISNFDPRLKTVLRNMKIDNYFDFVVCSYDVEAEKPDPQIFRKAEQLSGLTDLHPSECLHIGDTPTQDYFGAKEAGWNAVLIHEASSKNLYEKYGDKINQFHVFPSLFDFQKKITDHSIRL